MPCFDHISVDIETTGVDPEHSAIIQIGAVRFDPRTGEIDPNFFNRCLHMAPNRYWEESTRNWWLGMPDILQSIMDRMESPRQVLTDFYHWCGQDLRTAPILVAKPISFEHPMFQSYFRQFDLPMPWKYWEALDLRSFTQGRGQRYLDQELTFEGNAHDAFDDALHQMKTLLVCLERTGGWIE